MSKPNHKEGLMLIKDIMTTNVITVSPDTLMVEAGRIMEFHNIRRLPVVDKGKLVGIVTRERLLKDYPSQATSLSHWELNYLLAKIKVKDIMRKELVTVPPDITVEQGIAIAQKNKVGSLLVVEDGRLVGIATTNDFFYRILNPLMGIGEEGERVIVYKAGDPDSVQKVMDLVKKAGLKVKSFCTMPSYGDTPDLVLQFVEKDVGGLLKELRGAGFSADLRPHKA